MFLDTIGLQKVKCGMLLVRLMDCGSLGCRLLELLSLHQLPEVALR